MSKLHQFTLHLEDDKGRHLSSYSASVLVYFVLTCLFVFNQIVLFIQLHVAFHDEAILIRATQSKAIIFAVKISGI